MELEGLVNDDDSEGDVELGDSDEEILDSVGDDVLCSLNKSAQQVCT